MYWSELWGFIKRNILTIVLLTVVAVAMPWTLIFIIPVVLITLRLQMAMWKMRRTYGQNFQQNYRQQEHNNTKQGSHKEGNVTVVRTEQSEQRVSDDVGEYVDFKEIKEEETK